MIIFKWISRKTTRFIHTVGFGRGFLRLLLVGQGVPYYPGHWPWRVNLMRTRHKEEELEFNFRYSFLATMVFLNVLY
jgi:hypothetical protein